MNVISEVWRDYSHRVPVIIHDNLQRESCKGYVPRTSVTWLQPLRRRILASPPLDDLCLRLQKHTDLRAHDFSHSPDLWNQPGMLTISHWSWRICEINPAIHYACEGVQKWNYHKEVKLRLVSTEHRSGTSRFVNFCVERNYMVCVWKLIRVLVFKRSSTSVWECLFYIPLKNWTAWEENGEL
jgi:hypothetical protein